MQLKKILMGLCLVAGFFATGAFASVNINTAGSEELQQLKGVGPVTAQKIIQDRKTNGEYKSVDELERVKGIGSKTVEDIADNATVDTPKSSN